MATDTIPTASAVQSVIGNSGKTTAKIAIADLALNMLGTGLIPTDRIYPQSWADLAALPGPFTARKGAEVPESDLGTHVDPVTAQTVPNAGTYTFIVPAGWRRVGDNGLGAALRSIDKLNGDVAQLIGRENNPAGGGGVSGSVFIWADPISNPGTLKTLRLDVLATGNLKLTRWRKNGNSVVRLGEVQFAATATGLQTFDIDDFGFFPVAAGDYIGLWGSGRFGASGGVADGAGWWQVTDGITQTDLSAKFTNIVLQAQFVFEQRDQVVTAERFQALEDAAGGAGALADKVALLSGIVQNTVGRKANPESGSGVADQVFIWTEAAGTGKLVSVKVYALAAGTLQLSLWSKVGIEVTRKKLIDLVATSNGLQTFDEADFGDINTVAGDYFGLRGAGLYGANSTPADGAGWWQVSPYANPGNVDGPYTSHRLEAQFVVESAVQVVTAGGFKDLEERIDGLEGNDAAVSDGSLIAVSEWSAPGALNRKAPVVGGRGRQHIKPPLRQVTLAHFPARANIYNAPASITDASDGDPIYGGTTPRLVTVGGTRVNLAPATVNVVATDVRNGSIRWNFRPIAGMFDKLDLFGIELHSAGTPAAPTANYHSSDTNAGPYLLAGSLTGRTAPGRWQTYSIASRELAPVGSGADLTAIRFARVVLRSPAGNSATVAIGNVTFVPNWFTRAKAVLYFDDGYLPQMTYAAKEMARYGFRGVMFPSPARNTGVMPDRLTAEHIIALHDVLGWQIGSQAWSTEEASFLDALNEDGFTAELAKLRNWQNALGVTGGDHGSYFSGVGVDDMIAWPAFRKHFRTMRSFGGGWDQNPPMVYGETLPYGDPMGIRALDAETPSWGATNGERLCAHVDQAIANKGLAAMVWHGGMGAAGNVRTGLDTVLAYLDAHRDTIDVVTEEDIHHWPIAA